MPETFDILYQDDHLLVVDKPAERSLLADRMSGEAGLWPEIKRHCAAAGLPEPKIVHRVDKGTSGALITALSSSARVGLNRQFAEGALEKRYIALVEGAPEPTAGLIDLPLCPGRKSRHRIAGPREAIFFDPERRAWRLPDSVDWPKRAFPSQTRYRVVGTDGQSALLALRPLTGRAHQLRVHLAWLGWPIVGDRLYGKSQAPAARLALHCHRLQIHADWLTPPRRLTFRAPLERFDI